MKAKKSTRLLLVDDDQSLAQSMGEWLLEMGFDVWLARNIAEGEAVLSDEDIDVALIDIRLGNEDGFDLLRRSKKLSPNTTSIMITGYGTADTGVAALREGAFDLLTKPLIDDELLMSIEKAMTNHKVLEENKNLRSQLDNKFALSNIVGNDERMRKTFEIIDSVADTKATVLITGESGTGKSLLARAVHQRSDRRSGPFIEVACGALPENLLESELFGHVAGAFTGATGNKDGKFKLAEGGTLFLDEIGTASPALQVKLLRVLQEFQFEQVGGTKTFKADTRVVLATNEDLGVAVSEGRFRQDLYYRINVINLQLPSLRERVDDIPALANFFLQKVCSETGRKFVGFDSDAMSALQQYGWPGNVRELQNVIERAVLLGKHDRVLGCDLPANVLGEQRVSDSPILQSAAPTPNKRMTLKEALEGPERQIILQTLRENNWSRNATADQLGINRTTLYKKMRKLGLETPGFAYND
ncbi:MAG: sigma-54 dependent transcriptional regulator [Pirellulaceae bacterium]